MRRLKDLFHYLFIPSERNNLRARLLHHDILTIYLVFAFFLVFFVKTFATPSNVLGIATDISVQKLYEFTNRERQKHNLSPLSYNEKLSEAALKKAKDMFSKNYWAHYSPQGSAPWDFIVSSGYQYEYAGENLAKNFLFSQNVVDAWIASKSHRENLLQENFTDVGFAVANGVLNGEETTLVVQFFGSPLKQNLLGMPKKPEVASVKKENTNQLVQPAALSLNVTYVLLAFLFVIFALDLAVASRLRLVRFHGKNLAHLIFLGTVFFGLYVFLSKGAIL